ncbi:hypothetical protein D3C87_658020 [compost metagenome]
MTPEELAATITLVCGETVKFEYSVCTKRGVATSTWKMYQSYLRGGRKEWTTCQVCFAHGPSKAAAMEMMVGEALKWADQLNASRERMRKYREKMQARSRVTK